MDKKIRLLTLAAINSIILLLPSSVIGQEIHTEGLTSFSGTGSASSIVASGESTITCENAEVYGSIGVGGTTGNIEIYRRGCHTTVFGITAKCRTATSASDNAIATYGTLHLITVNGKPGMLVTPALTEVICAGISNTLIEGLGVMGTITSPACGSGSTEMTVSFSAVGSTQNHRTYTALTEVNLKAKTPGGSSVPAGLTSSLTINGSNSKLNCT